MKITEVQGYTIDYEPGHKKFYLKDSEGEIVGQGKTQQEVEDQAKKLAKRGFKPIAALKRSNLVLDMGRVTSLNLADHSVRFSFDDRKGSGAIKARLSYGTEIYELTDYNRLIKEQIDGLFAETQRIEKRIRDLMEQLEKPINLKYFDL